MPSRVIETPITPPSLLPQQRYPNALAHRSTVSTMTATPEGFTRMYCIPRILENEEMDGLIALARSEGLTAGTTSGGPVEVFQVTVQGVTATFDGFLYTPGDIVGNLQDKYNNGNHTSGPLAADDDVNISNKGVGIKDNQIDPGEGLALFFSTDIEGIRIILDGGTGGNTTFDVRIQAFDNGTVVHTQLYDDVTLPKGTSTETLDFLPGVSFDQIYIVHDLVAPNGVRIPQIFTFTAADIPDFKLDFTVKSTDFDGDMDSESFYVQIDGDLDGQITDPIPV